MPKPYPKEFRDDVVQVALNRESGVRIKDVEADFRITESCLGTGSPRPPATRAGNPERRPPNSASRSSPGSNAPSTAAASEQRSDA